MKSIYQYITEAEDYIDNPAAGDVLEIEVAREEMVIAAPIVECVEDGIVLGLDAKGMELFESYGYVEEDWRKGVGALAIVGSLLGLSAYDTQQMYKDSPQLQQLTRNLDAAMAAGDKTAIENYKQRIMQHKTRLGLGQGEVMGADGEPKKVEIYKEGVMSEIDIDLQDIADTEDYDKLYDAISGLHGAETAIYLEDMIADIARDHRLHWDDDIDEIMEILMDRIVADRSASGSSQEVTKESSHDKPNPMATAVMRRIAIRHPEWITKYGAEALIQAIDDVTEGEEDWEEIGTSDVSAFVRQVYAQLEDRMGSREEMDHRKPFAEAGIDPNLHPQTRDYGRGEDTDSYDELVTQYNIARATNNLNKVKEIGAKLMNLTKGAGFEVNLKGEAKPFSVGANKNTMSEDSELDEAEYRGRKVKLNKPMRGDVKKSKVYVKDPKTGNIKKVNFGDPNMKIKKNIPGRRKNFRARHNCDNPGPKTKARYWSCRAW